MGYRVEIFRVEAGLFGGVKYQKLTDDLLAKLNDLESKGYDVVSVIELNQDSKDVIYQIISKKL